MSKTCVLFTKSFPFGHREHYLVNELPFLLNVFDRVLIVPVDEYAMNAEHNRVAAIERVEVIGINRIPVTYGIADRLKREWRVWNFLVKEFLLSREKRTMCKKWRRLLSMTRHLYRSSRALNSVLSSHSLHPENAVFYHYWFHNGVVLTHFYHRFFSDTRFANVARAHSGDLYHSDWNTMQRAKEAFIPFEQMKWREVDHVFAISSHGLSFMHRVFPQFASKTSIARLGVLDKGVQHPYSALEEKVLVTCTHLSPNKRLFRLPEILHFVPFQIRWVHFGGGSEQELQDLQKALNDQCPHVKFEFKGAVPNDAIISFYGSEPVHLILNLSEAEGIPVALMEAASFGIPMLATATIGNPEIVNDSNGILIPVDFESESVARLIGTLISDAQLWQEASRQSRKTFEDFYEAERNYSAFARSLLNRIH